MDKISIIIPIFNVDCYLKKCIDSVINQTYTNIEIILVNDGSTDSSLKICNEYKNLDKRIIIVDKQNEGVSSARNAGLNIASGDYIGFVDPDDWIELDMYESMYNDIRHNDCDIVMCSYTVERTNHDSINMNLKINDGVYKDNEIIENIVSNMISPPSLNSTNSTIMGSVWRLLVKSNILKENNILFDNNLNFCEDLLFSIKTFLKCNKVYIQKKYNYHYYCRENSAVQAYRKNFSKEYEILIDKIINVLQQNDLDIKLKDRVCVRKFISYFEGIGNYLKKDSDAKFYEIIEFIKKFCNDKLVIDIINAENLEHFTPKRKLYVYSVKKKLYYMVYISYIF